MKEEHAQPLIAYGRWLIAHVAGQSPGAAPPWVTRFTEPLGWSRDEVPASPLQSILTLIDLDHMVATPAYLRPVPLGLDSDRNGQWVLSPVPRAEATEDRADLYRSFLAAGGGQEGNFDRFFYLMRKFASTLPNTYGEPGVSLFEQWKLIAALVAVSGSTTQLPETLGLVGGDIPGIQRTVNLITSKGAAKAMRGRSAFIQLLGDALVRRLLDRLELGPANVVYDAGGNFVLLTGWEEGADGIAARVQQVADEVNRILLAGIGAPPERFDGFHGDLSVAVAAEPLREGIEALRWNAAPATLPGGATASLWQAAEKRLKNVIAAAKNRPFGDLTQTAEGFRLLFEREPAETDVFCAVCRRQERADERATDPQQDAFQPLDPDEPGSALACPECRGFNALADDLGHGDRRLVLSLQPLNPDRIAGWQRALAAISGYWYSFERPEHGRSATRSAAYRPFALSVDDFPAHELAGFRWLAHTTPLKSSEGKTTIKTNSDLAAASEGIKRLGVLRMDVDNLGDLIVRGLPARTPVQTAELSQTLERFFAGWLDCICKRVDGGAKLFYVLFAGGDDLFVIGPWNLMPTLATAIRNDFHQYCNEHPAVHLSGGIAVVDEHAPMHEAAEESDGALAAAKKLDEGTASAKNALTFLGRTHHWPDFDKAGKLQHDIVELADDADLGNALITRLLAIDLRYRRERRHGPYAAKGSTPHPRGGVIFYGPWMWQQVYAFGRLAEGHDGRVRDRLFKLQSKLVDDNEIGNLGLAARWAQLLTRKES